MERMPSCTYKNMSKSVTLSTSDAERMIQDWGEGGRVQFRKLKDMDCDPFLWIYGRKRSVLVVCVCARIRSLTILS